MSRLVDGGHLKFDDQGGPRVSSGWATAIGQSVGARPRMPVAPVYFETSHWRGNHLMTVRNLDCLLKPRSVALIGASRRAQSIGATVARNLFGSGFDGP